MSQISTCCNAPVKVESSRTGTTHWHVCTKCQQPCGTESIKPKMKAVLLACLIPIFAEAAPEPLPVNVNVTVGDGFNALNDRDRRWVFKHTKAKYLEVGISPKIKAKRRRDPAASLRTLDSMYKYFYKWVDVVHALKVLDIRAKREADVYGVLGAPLKDGWKAGLALMSRRIFWVAAGITDPKLFLVQLEKALIVFIHELGHTLGAVHDGTPGNFMHPNAMAYANGQNRMFFTAKTIRQIGGYGVSKRRRGR